MAARAGGKPLELIVDACLIDNGARDGDASEVPAATELCAEPSIKAGKSKKKPAAASASTANAKEIVTNKPLRARNKTDRFSPPSDGRLEIAPPKLAAGQGTGRKGSGKSAGKR